MSAITLPVQRLCHAGRSFGPLLLLPLMLGSVGTRSDPAPDRYPFTPGETFNYRVRLGRLGTVGHGVMRVEGPVKVRGRSVYLLSFGVRARVGFAVVKDSTRSWIDPETMATLRYYKRENSPLGRGVESVDIFPEERRWTSADGRSGETPCARPLDELSFLYFVRTLPLADGETYRLEHHFDDARNPVLVQVLRREAWSGPGGSGRVVVIEMRVKDAEHFGGDGTVRLFLTDDDRRIPVRIESRVPIFGSMVLTLESQQS